MEIIKINSLAKSCMTEKDHNKFMSNINTKNLNSARLFLEDKIDEIVFSKKMKSIVEQQYKYTRLKELDNIVTNEYINQIDVNA